jgi:phospholipid-transporting ATPase
LVKVSEDEAIPADLVLVKSSDPKGTLYIETKNLDGETNLKNKYVHKDINEKFASDMTAM